MDELAIKQQEVLKTMDVGYLPSLPEERLGDSDLPEVPVSGSVSVGNGVSAAGFRHSIGSQWGRLAAVRHV